MKKIIPLIFFLVLLAQGHSFAQTFKVVVNSGIDINSLTKNEVSDLFLKKKTKWANGTSVMPVDQSVNSSVRNLFSQQVFEKSVAAIRSYWQQTTFSGIASAPPEKSSDNEVVEYIKRTPGAIGYVSATTNIEGVRVITIK